MPAGMSTAKARRSSKTKASGFSRARANMPAKAGKRKPPAKAGVHVTDRDTRNRAMWLSVFGLKPYDKPQGWMAKN